MLVIIDHKHPFSRIPSQSFNKRLQYNEKYIFLSNSSINSCVLVKRKKAKHTSVSGFKIKIFNEDFFWQRHLHMLIKRSALRTQSTEDQKEKTDFLFLLIQI